MKRTAKAYWSGTLKEGDGELTTQSSVLNKVKYSYRSRFEENQKGTNPEELLAAAHAGCFTMWVASLLTQKGLTPKSLDTEATIVIEGTDIKGIHLIIEGSVQGINGDEFKLITSDAAKNCIVSRALSIPITSESQLTSEKAKKLSNH